MLKPLLWKEWHEQRWKLAFGTVMLVFFTGSLLAARVSSDKEIIVAVMILGSLILSLYSAMGVFAPETTNQTRTFLAAKPVAPWKIFFSKWLFGWLNFAVPILICSLVLAVMVLAHPEEELFELEFLARVLISGIGLGTMFYSMTCCLAPRKSGEAMVGFVGLIIFVIFFAHMFIMIFTFIDVARHHETTWNLGEVLSFINPVFWIHLMKPVSNYSPNSVFLLFIEQGILFMVVILVGLRKWQRSS